MNFKKVFLPLLFIHSIASLKAEEKTAFNFKEFANAHEVEIFLKELHKAYLPELYDSYLKRIKILLYDTFSDNSEYGNRGLHLLLFVSHRNSITIEERRKIVEAFKYALNQRKGDINDYRDDGSTLLHQAINRIKLKYPSTSKAEDLLDEEMFEALLEKGANPHIKNKITQGHLGMSAKDLLEIAYGIKTHPAFENNDECRNDPESEECLKVKRMLERVNQMEKK